MHHLMASDWHNAGVTRPILFAVTLALAAATVQSAEVRTEIGEINGAAFRIDLPENWNGGLVMYCHGYAAQPGKFKPGPPNALAQIFLDRGYAIAQSGYATGGWAIAEAVVDTEGLRRYFETKHGKAKETWVTGHSMGGFLTMLLMERYPAAYHGGLPLCGPLDGPLSFIGRGAFDARVLFDFHFPGLLSSPDKVTETRDRRQLTAEVRNALDAAPAKAEALRRREGVRTNEDLADTIVFITFLLQELQARAGGNPFDNRSVIYTNTGDDNAVNAGVKRFAADPKALAYLRANYTPTGRLLSPMLAIHTTYDPLVPATVPNRYQSLAEAAGSGDLFLQQFVRRDGHCQINPQETGRGFDELRAWVKTGQRPTPGDRTIAP